MDPAIVIVASLLGSIIVTAITVGVFTGKQKEKISSLEKEKEIIWKKINRLEQDSNSSKNNISQIKITVGHLETSISQLTDDNKDAFNNLTLLINGLGDKLADNYVRKDDIELYLNKGE